MGLQRRLVLRPPLRPGLGTHGPPPLPVVPAAARSRWPGRAMGAAACCLNQFGVTAAAHLTSTVVPPPAHVLSFQLWQLYLPSISGM